MSLTNSPFTIENWNCWCAKFNLIVEKEEELDSNDALVNESGVSDLGEESEELGRNDTNFYKDSSDDDDEYDEDEIENYNKEGGE